MGTKKSAVLKTPVDGQGNRVDIHLINTTDEVLIPGSNGKTLTTKMDEFKVTVSTSKPNHAGIWIDSST